MKNFNYFNRVAMVAFVASAALMSLGLGATDRSQVEREFKLVTSTLGGSVAAFVGKKLAVRQAMPKLASCLKYTSRGLMIPTASCALYMAGIQLAKDASSEQAKFDRLQLTIPYFLTVRLPMEKLFGDKK